MVFTLPPINSILQSAILAKYLLWVANTINLLVLLSLNNILKTSFAFLKSKLPVGSSAKIISGELIIDLEIANRCA